MFHEWAAQTKCKHLAWSVLDYNNTMTAAYHAGLLRQVAYGLLHSKAVITFMLLVHVMAATDTGCGDQAGATLFVPQNIRAGICHYLLPLIPATADWGYNPSYSCAEDMALVESVLLNFAMNSEDIKLLWVKFKDELAFLMKVASCCCGGHPPCATTFTLSLHMAWGSW